MYCILKNYVIKYPLYTLQNKIQFFDILLLAIVLSQILSIVKENEEIWNMFIEDPA